MTSDRPRSGRLPKVFVVRDGNLVARAGRPSLKATGGPRSRNQPSLSGWAVELAGSRVTLVGLRTCFSPG